MFDPRACRSCLTVKGKLEKIGEASKRQYTAITGLQISDSDGYPNYFCAECRVHIRKSLAFRRKSRRANFVLKEIMSVRKQVTYSDIVTVNRKRTNLESSLNFWDPQSSACFLIAKEEGKEEDLQKYNLQSQSHSKHLVEIKPEFEPPVPEETPIEQEANTYEEDILSNDYLDPEPDPDIDMNDIFKDLKEEQSEDEEVVEENEVKEVKASKNDSLKSVVDSLILFNIKVLTLNEQKDKMEIRKRGYPFVTAHYKCSMCLSVHKNMEELIEHVAYHNQRKFPHECQVCKNKFPQKEELDIHIANTHMYEYQCRICRIKAYCKKDAVTHAKSRHLYRNPQNASASNTWNNLAYALKTFKVVPLTPEMMKQLVTLPSSEPKKKDDVFVFHGFELKCDVCGIWLKLKSDMEKHMILKHRYMYTCILCKEVFTTRQKALLHKLHNCQEGGEENPNLITEKELLQKINNCEEMDVEYPNPLKELKTRKGRPKESDLKLPCNVCGANARNEQYLYRHQLKEHKYISINDPLVGEPEHKCEQCEVQFMDRYSLETHLVNTNHAGADGVPFACIPCKKRYKDEEQLETHYITCIYSRRYPRKCCYCSEMLHDAVQYKSHYVQSHPTLPYRYVSQNSICDICGKSIYKPMLEAHLKSHTGDTYQCRHCDMTHATPAQHVTHVLGNHTSCPYRCAACHRRFQYRSDCKDHILKVHAPTKLYKCEFCSTEFSYFGHLKKHSEKLHNLVIPPLKSNFQFKSKDRILVYAHMKIEINEMERSVVEKTNIELIDYLEQKSKPVDYNNYFIFNSEFEQNVVRKRRQARRKKEKAKSETEQAVGHIQLKYDYETKTEPSFVIQYKQSAQTQVKEFKVNDKEVKEIEVKNSDYEVNIETGEVEDSEECVNEVKDEEIKVEADDSEPLQVMENGDGHQYVMIGGEMYRIASEDDI